MLGTVSLSNGSIMGRTLGISPKVLRVRMRMSAKTCAGVLYAALSPLVPHSGFGGSPSSCLLRSSCCRIWRGM